MLGFGQPGEPVDLDGTEAQLADAWEEMQHVDDLEVAAAAAEAELEAAAQRDALLKLAAAKKRSLQNGGVSPVAGQNSLAEEDSSSDEAQSSSSEDEESASETSSEVCWPSQGICNRPFNSWLRVGEGRRKRARPRARVTQTRKRYPSCHWMGPKSTARAGSVSMSCCIPVSLKTGLIHLLCR